MRRKLSKRSRPDKTLDLAAFRREPDSSGVALDQLSAALAGMFNSGDDPYAATATEASAAGDAEAAVDAAAPRGDDACEITPKSILEAMLFVGTPDNMPLTSKKVAALMRGVRPGEIDALVRELNADYERRNCPYQVISEGAGYRLALRDEFAPLGERFHVKARQTRLSPAAIEVLAAVAYHEPITADEVTRLRGVASGAILTQLARRQLVRLERTDTKPRHVQYSTTPRFLELFGLQSLADLPRSADLEQS